MATDMTDVTFLDKTLRRAWRLTLLCPHCQVPMVRDRAVTDAAVYQCQDCASRWRPAC